MPLKLYPPREGHPSYYIRGTYLGVLVNQSAKTNEKALATKILKVRKREIERGIIKPGGTRTTVPKRRGCAT